MQSTLYREKLLEGVGWVDVGVDVDGWMGLRVRVGG
jgi:hypothetical protein